MGHDYIGHNYIGHNYIGKTIFDAAPSVSVRLGPLVGTAVNLFSFEDDAMKTALLAGRAGSSGFADGVGADAQFRYPVALACDWRAITI